MPIHVDKPETKVLEAASGGSPSIGPIDTSVVPEAANRHMSIGPVATSVPNRHMSIGPVASSVVAPGDKPKVDPAAIKAAVGHHAD